MKKRIEDYLHLHIGCEIDTPIGVVRLTGFGGGEIFYESIDYSIVELSSKGQDWDYTDIKLLLRPLSDMTEEESEEQRKFLFEQNYRTDDFIETLPFHNAQEMKWNLSNGFDIFNLIEVGLAIDKTKI